MPVLNPTCPECQSPIAPTDRRMTLSGGAVVHVRCNGGEPDNARDITIGRTLIFAHWVDRNRDLIARCNLRKTLTERVFTSAGGEHRSVAITEGLTDPERELVVSLFEMLEGLKLDG